MLRHLFAIARRGAHRLSRSVPKDLGNAATPSGSSSTETGLRRRLAGGGHRKQVSGVTPWCSGEEPWPSEDSLHGTLGDLQEGESLEQKEWLEAESYSFWGKVRPRDRHWRGRTNHYSYHYDGSSCGPCK